MQANLQALQKEVNELREYKVIATRAAENAKLRLCTFSHQIMGLQVDNAALKVQQTNYPTILNKPPPCIEHSQLCSTIYMI